MSISHRLQQWIGNVISVNALQCAKPYINYAHVGVRPVRRAYNQVGREISDARRCESRCIVDDQACVFRLCSVDPFEIRCHNRNKTCAFVRTLRGWIAMENIRMDVFMCMCVVARAFFCVWICAQETALFIAERLCSNVYASVCVCVRVCARCDALDRIVGSLFMIFCCVFRERIKDVVCVCVCRHAVRIGR